MRIARIVKVVRIIRVKSFIEEQSARPTHCGYHRNLTKLYVSSVLVLTMYGRSSELGLSNLFNSLVTRFRPTCIFCQGSRHLVARGLVDLLVAGWVVVQFESLYKHFNT